MLPSIKKFVRKMFNRTKQPQENEAEVIKEHLGKKIFKKFIASPKKSLKKQTKEKKPLKAKVIEEIAMLIKNYENFIKKDFIMIIHEANSMLRSWRNEIMNYIATANANKPIDKASFSHDLDEINLLYTQSEVALNNMIANCQNYHKILDNTKKSVSPEQKLTQIQIQLERVIHNLRKGLEISNLERNSDYNYLASYIQKSQTLSGISHTKS